MKESYLLDTDIVIYWLKGLYTRINKKIEETESNLIFISSVTAAELYYGAYNSFKSDENLKLVDELIKEINILNFDPECGKLFGKIKAELKQKGEIINDSDLFIAATAIFKNYIFVTNNEKHFRRIHNLRLQNWVKSASLK